MPFENCLVFNWHSSRAAPEISFFKVPTKDDEYYYRTTWRNNIVAVIIRDTGDQGNLKRQIKNQTF